MEERRVLPAHVCVSVLRGHTLACVCSRALTGQVRDSVIPPVSCLLAPAPAPHLPLFQMIWTQILVEGESFTKCLIYVLLHMGLLVSFTDHLLFV